MTEHGEASNGPDQAADSGNEATNPRTPEPTSRGGQAIEMRTAPLQRRIDTPQPHRTMPADFAISLASKQATDQVIAHPRGGRKQPMRGFEDTFTDIIDFILRCTHRIWDEKGVGYLYEHYRSNTRVVDDAGIVYGRDQVIENTLQFIAAFPDIRLHPDEIIWCGDEEMGFWTSHRTVLLGHNTGWSKWGPPTGRKIVVWCIANCYSIENQIVDEFVIYNTASLMRQLEVDIRTAAAKAAADHPAVLDPTRAGEVERLLGQSAPPKIPPSDGASAIENFVRRSLHEIWNWRLLNRIEDAYAAGIRFHGPTDRELYGRGQYAAYVLGLLAAFPDLAYQIDDLYWMGNDTDGYLAAVRWTISGTHRGPGSYGEATHKPIHMWGITHLKISDAQIVEEWTVANEFDVMCQLAADPHL